MEISTERVLQTTSKGIQTTIVAVIVIVAVLVAAGLGIYLYSSEARETVNNLSDTANESTNLINDVLEGLKNKDNEEVPTQAGDCSLEVDETEIKIGERILSVISYNFEEPVEEVILLCGEEEIVSDCAGNTGGCSQGCLPTKEGIVEVSAKVDGKTCENQFEVLVQSRGR